MPKALKTIKKWLRTVSWKRKNPPKRVIVYVDGFNLYYGMKSSKWQRYYWLDVCALSRHLVRSDQVLVGTKYFSARIARPPDKVMRQSTYLEAIEALPGIQIEYGRYRSDLEACTQCGHERFVDDEKMTDVNIAVQMLLDAADDRFDIAFLISGDTDLINAVCAVQNRYAKQVWMAFPPNRTSPILADYAKGRVRIKEKMLRLSQMPTTVRSKIGYPLTRPKEWN